MKWFLLSFVILMCSCIKDSVVSSKKDETISDDMLTRSSIPFREMDDKLKRITMSEVSVTVTNRVEGLELTVREVSINNLWVNGIYVILSDSDFSKGYWNTYDSTLGSFTFDTVEAKDLVKGEKVTTGDSTIVIIPQKRNGWNIIDDINKTNGCHATIDCKIVQNGNNVIWNGKSYVPLDVSLKAGKDTIEIPLDLSRPWYRIDENGKAIKILNPIGFSVTVEGWKETETDINL